MFPEFETSIGDILWKTKKENSPKKKFGSGLMKNVKKSGAKIGSAVIVIENKL